LIRLWPVKCWSKYEYTNFFNWNNREWFPEGQGGGDNFLDNCTCAGWGLGAGTSFVVKREYGHVEEQNKNNNNNWLGENKTGIEISKILTSGV
jgi:hypothetical protein